MAKRPRMKTRDPGKSTKAKPDVKRLESELEIVQLPKSLKMNSSHVWFYATNTLLFDENSFSWWSQWTAQSHDPSQWEQDYRLTTFISYQSLTVQHVAGGGAGRGRGPSRSCQRGDDGGQPVQETTRGRGGRVGQGIERRLKVFITSCNQEGIIRHFAQKFENSREMAVCKNVNKTNWRNFFEKFKKTSKNSREMKDFPVKRSASNNKGEARSNLTEFFKNSRKQTKILVKRKCDKIGNDTKIKHVDLTRIFEETSWHSREPKN